MSALVVDANVLFAVLDRRDSHHDEAVALLQEWPGSVHVPQVALAEVASLASSRLGAHVDILLAADLSAGSLLAEPAVAADWEPAAALVAAYADLPLGLVDALVAVATARLRGVLATYDRRHFGVLRLPSGEALALLP